jgi:hypothetical protein
VFVLDWSDTGECHNATGVNRLSGRIYKITVRHALAGRPRSRPRPPRRPRRAARSRQRLVGPPGPSPTRRPRRRRSPHLRDAAAQLRTHRGTSRTFPVDRLRALWTLYAMGATDEAFLLTVSAIPMKHVRTWAVRLLSDALAARYRAEPAPRATAPPRPSAPVPQPNSSVSPLPILPASCASPSRPPSSASPSTPATRPRHRPLVRRSRGRGRPQPAPAPLVRPHSPRRPRRPRPRRAR